MDYEADHPSDHEDRTGGEEFAFGLASCWAVQEQVEHKSAESDRYESNGDEVNAECSSNDEADDCPRDGVVDVFEYCHESLSVIQLVSLSVAREGYYLGGYDAISRVSLSVYQSVRDGN